MAKNDYTEVVVTDPVGDYPERPYADAITESHLRLLRERGEAPAGATIKAAKAREAETGTSASVDPFPAVDDRV